LQNIANCQLPTAIYFFNFAFVKKVVLAIIAVLYLVSASGIVVDIHYCMGQIAAEKENCCDTQTKWIKLQDAHQPVKLPKQFKQLSAEANNIPRFTVTDRWMATGQYYTLPYIAPPNQKVNSIYLHNCVFRI
jgi:hypothetical protein